MKSRNYSSRGSRGLMVFTALLVGAGTLASVALNPFAARKRAQMARDLNNARQVKFALDGFATDFDGQYPNADTSEKIVQGGTGTKTSNDYFQQLFLSGQTNSEVIFWVKGATVCTPKKPDDLVADGGRPRLKEILKAGDCGWAYMTNQTDTSNVARPIIISAYKIGTKEFDKKLYRGKVAMIRIDGSAKMVELSPQGLALVDGQDVLSAKSRPWAKSGENPAKLLKQPLPVAQKAAKAKAGPVKEAPAKND